MDARIRILVRGCQRSDSFRFATMFTRSYPIYEVLHSLNISSNCWIICAWTFDRWSDKRDELIDRSKTLPANATHTHIYRHTYSYRFSWKWLKIFHWGDNCLAPSICYIFNLFKQPRSFSITYQAIHFSARTNFYIFRKAEHKKNKTETSTKLCTVYMYTLRTLFRSLFQIYIYFVWTTVFFSLFFCYIRQEDCNWKWKKKSHTVSSYTCIRTCAIVHRKSWSGKFMADKMFVYLCANETSK